MQLQVQAADLRHAIALLLSCGMPSAHSCSPSPSIATPPAAPFPALVQKRVAVPADFYRFLQRGWTAHCAAQRAKQARSKSTATGGGSGAAAGGSGGGSGVWEAGGEGEDVEVICLDSPTAVGAGQAAAAAAAAEAKEEGGEAEAKRPRRRGRAAAAQQGDGEQQQGQQQQPKAEPKQEADVVMLDADDSSDEPVDVTGERGGKGVAKEIREQYAGCLRGHVLPAQHGVHGVEASSGCGISLGGCMAILSSTAGLQTAYFNRPPPAPPFTLDSALQRRQQRRRQQARRAALSLRQTPCSTSQWTRRPAPPARCTSRRPSACSACVWGALCAAGWACFAHGI